MMDAKFFVKTLKDGLRMAQLASGGDKAFEQGAWTLLAQVSLNMALEDLQNPLTQELLRLQEERPAL